MSVVHVHYPQKKSDYITSEIQLNRPLRCTRDVLRNDATDGNMPLSCTYPNPFLEATLILLSNMKGENALNLPLLSYNSKFPITTQLNSLNEMDSMASINHANHNLSKILMNYIQNNIHEISKIDTQLYLPYHSQDMNWPDLCSECKYAPATSSNVENRFCYTCALKTNGVTQGKLHYRNAEKSQDVCILDIERSPQELERIKVLHDLVEENDPRFVIENGSHSIGYSESTPHPLIPVNVPDANWNPYSLCTNTMTVLTNISINSDWHWTSLGNQANSKAFEHCEYCQGRFDAVLFAYPCMHSHSCVYCYVNKLALDTHVLMCHKCNQPFSWLLYLHRYTYVEETLSVKLITHNNTCVNMMLLPHFPLKRHAGEDPERVIRSNPNIHNAWNTIRVLAMLKWLHNDKYAFPFETTLKIKGKIFSPLKIYIPLQITNTKCCVYDRANDIAYLPIHNIETKKFCTIQGNFLNVCRILSSYNTCLLKYSLFQNIGAIPESIRIPQKTFLSLPKIPQMRNIINTLSFAALNDVNAATSCIELIVEQLVGPMKLLDADAILSFASFNGRIYEIMLSYITQHTFPLKN
uniref:Putative inhibitor of apoptosis 1 diap1 n=1 Tax=Ixodes ricinus TaxID=34613 RepID=A0A0K8RHK9_IXORI